MNKIYKVLLFICFISIEFLSTTTLEIEIVESIWDKANHFIAFFVLYILLSLSYKKLSIKIKVLLLTVYGLHIEIIQSFIDGRHFSLLDVVADIIGIAIGVVLYKLVVMKLPQRFL